VKYKTTVFSISIILLLLSAGYAQQEQAKPTTDSKKAVPVDLRPARVVHREPPAYPQDAEAKGITGYVVVEAVVDKQGNVSRARLIEGDQVFRDAAVAAVKTWKFEPAALQGQPIEQMVQIKMRFCGKHGCPAGP
jgi:TonB family protein